MVLYYVAFNCKSIKLGIKPYNSIVPTAIMIITYWTLGTLFTVVDITGKPTFITQYRIQNESSQNRKRISLCDVKHVANQVLFNQTVVAVPVIILCFYIKRWRGYATELSLPFILEFLHDFIIYSIAEEIIFYYLHRLLHSKLMYRRYHKRHHQWTSPIGISAIYCHPVEHVLSNVLPTHIGPVIAGSHITVFWLWMVLSTAYGIIVHSGYHLPFLPSPQHHDFHHTKFTENFGAIGLLDWVHGTNQQFRLSKAFQKHKIHWTLKNYESGSSVQ